MRAWGPAGLTTAESSLRMQMPSQPGTRSLRWTEPGSPCPDRLPPPRPWPLTLRITGLPRAGARRPQEQKRRHRVWEELTASGKREVQQSCLLSARRTICRLLNLVSCGFEIYFRLASKDPNRRDLCSVWLMCGDQNVCLCSYDVAILRSSWPRGRLPKGALGTPNGHQRRHPTGS